MLTVATIALITAIGAVIVVPVTGFLKKETWSAHVKQAIAMVISLGVSAVAIAIKDPSAFGLGFVQLGALIFAGSQIFYAFFKGSSLEKQLARYSPLSPGPKTP